MPSTPGAPHRPWRSHLHRALGRPTGALARPLDGSRSRALLLTVLGLAPALLLGGAVTVHELADAAHRARTATAHRHHLEAVLLTPAGHPPPAGHADTAVFTAEATWTYPPGQPHSGPVTVAASAATGSTARLWVDDNGDPAAAPPTTAGLAAEAVALGLFTFGGLAALLALALHTRLHALDRRADRAWQRAWASYEPLWSSRGRGPSGSPGLDQRP
ncbi:hypothetical protein ABT095_19090 [Kitasatospora sp. NPDC002227]|uniref:Rv1733c family protein n=1 Tax=Kitasatospora sp. NPDC002227 TaxID=3154773 RepID=UPI00332A4240